MKGNIQWYDTRKGYGFIHSVDGKDIFISRTAVPSDTLLNKGDEVQFEIEKSQHGPKAKNVKKI